MIYFLDAAGKYYKRGPIDYRQYRLMLKRFTIEELKELRNFLYRGDYSPFSVGTRYRNPWPKELMVLYEKLGEALAAEFLGVFLFNLLIEDHRKWFCTKTQLNNRDLLTMFYAPILSKDSRP